MTEVLKAVCKYWYTLFQWNSGRDHSIMNYNTQMLCDTIYVGWGVGATIAYRLTSVTMAMETRAVETGTVESVDMKTGAIKTGAVETGTVVAEQ